MYSAQALEVRDLSRLLTALADETRLRIVALLSHGELCVCHLQAVLGISQPNVSRHLGLLRTADAVEQRRHGNWVYYRLAPQRDPQRKRLLQALVQSFAQHEELKGDLDRVVKKAGPEACR